MSVSSGKVTEYQSTICINFVIVDDDLPISELDMEMRQESVSKRGRDRRLRSKPVVLSMSKSSKVRDHLLCLETIDSMPHIASLPVVVG
jgi:hypothetical protein